MSERPNDSNDNDEVLSFLDVAETVFRRMIVGIFRFAFTFLPTWLYQLFQHFFNWLGTFLQYTVRWLYQLFQHFFNWLGTFLQYTLKLSRRVVRVLFFATIWVLMIFGPLILTSAFDVFDSLTLRVVGSTWAVTGLVGSIWGLNRWWHRITARVTDASASHSSASTLVQYFSWLLIFIGVAVIGVVFEQAERKSKKIRVEAEQQEAKVRAIAQHEKILAEWPTYDGKRYPIVYKIDKESIARTADIRPGDVWVSYNGTSLAELTDFSFIYRLIKEAGDKQGTVEVVFVRQGIAITKTIQAGQHLGVYLRFIPK